VGDFVCFPFGFNDLLKAFQPKVHKFGLRPLKGETFSLKVHKFWEIFGFNIIGHLFGMANFVPFLYLVKHNANMVNFFHFF
jgi:hypothetical protein